MPNGSMTLGVDKSSQDGILDWQIAKSRGLSWATLHASYGTTKDVTYSNNYKAALEAGFNIIPYHWYVPKKYSPQAQAMTFLEVAPTSNMPAMLDLENNGASQGYIGIGTRELKPWLDIVQSATGRIPFIYASPSYISSYLASETWLSEYPLIIAHWRVAAPLVPKPWTPVGLAGWQFSGDDCDAKYYGFQQAKGCSLQVLYNIENFVISI
jgi:GH25 family lysozyme M1 (1,4-beta-N-acetylmuramidase)